MSAPATLWRSMLYVPAHVDRFVQKAHLRGADCLILDLEDAVPAAMKEEARRGVADAAAQVRRAGADVVVRINRPLSHAVRDIEAAVCPDVDGFSISKAASPSHIQLLDELISEVELKRGMRVGHSRLVALVETAAAWPALVEIARASPRIVALSMGSEDFALDCGMESDSDTMLLPKQQLVHAAGAAQVLPLGLIGSVTDYADLEGYRAVVRRSRRHGFVGASCVHPQQVPILNELFAPTDEEVARARKVVEALEQAERLGLGAVGVDGQMVDAPVARRAERVLALQAAIESRREVGELVR